MSGANLRRISSHADATYAAIHTQTQGARLTHDRVPFARVLQAEWLKARRSSPLRLALTMPWPLSLLGLLMAASTDSAMVATYAWNYWALLACPAMIALICTAVANLDRRQQLRTILALPLAPRRIWWAKCVECWLLLLVSNLCTWLITLAGMSLMNLTVLGVPENLATAMSVTVMLAWMVPCGLWLSTWLGSLAGIAVPLLVQVSCAIMLYDAAFWWLVPPSGVLRVIAPFAGVMPDGSPLEPASPYSQFTMTSWLALLVAVVSSALLAWLTGRWFDHREAR